MTDKESNIEPWLRVVGDSFRPCRFQLIERGEFAAFFARRGNLDRTDSLRDTYLLERRVSGFQLPWRSAKWRNWVLQYCNIAIDNRLDFHALSGIWRRVSLFTSKSRKTPLLFHMLVWTASTGSSRVLECLLVHYTHLVKICDSAIVYSRIRTHGSRTQS
jgi:hypothetical protein